MISNILGVIVIIVGLLELALVTFAGMMHTVPQNPTFGEVALGVAIIAVGAAIIWMPACPPAGGERAAKR